MLDPELWGTVITALTSTQTFAVTPDDEITVTVGDDDTDRVYTVENAVAGAEHTIELFNAENVSVDDDGVVTFDEAGDEADAGTVEAAITVLNNSAVATPGQLATVEQVGGQITFTVDIDDAVFESVIPVVYFDEDESGGLNVDSDGLPSNDEPFGLGGAYTVFPSEAEAGGLNTDEIVITFNEDATLAGESVTSPSPRRTSRASHSMGATSSVVTAATRGLSSSLARLTTRTVLLRTPSRSMLASPRMTTTTTRTLPLRGRSTTDRVAPKGS